MHRLSQKGLAHVLMSLMEEKGHPKADENKKERRSKDLDKDARKALELLCLCIGHPDKCLITMENWFP